MRTFAIVACALGLAAGCGRGKHETGTHEAAPPLAIDGAAAALDAAPAEVDAASSSSLPASCEGPLRGLAALIARMHKAMEPEAPRAKAIAAWQAVEAPCRRSAWYLAAAQLERWNRETLVAGGVTIDNPEDAIVAGLAANDDRGILVLVAFAAGLGEPPLLPRDACKRAAAIAGDADDLAYVCGHAALAARDPAAAAQQFGAIAAPARYPDLLLRQAEAEAGLGHADRAEALWAKAAKLDEQVAHGFGATGREYGKLVSDAQNRR